MIYNPFDRILWVLGFIVAFTEGIIYLIKGIKRENLNDKLILIGFSSFIILRILPNVLFPFITDFLIEGT